jgi:DNA repair protein RadC
LKKTDWQNKGAGHRGRLRDKFLALGIDAFSDSEILELLLTLGTPRKDCKETARAALAHFGSLARVLDASTEKLQTIHGIGPKNAFAVHFLHGVARRYLKAQFTDKEYLQSSREVADYLVHTMRDQTIEIFEVMLLDASHAIIGTQTVAEGSLTTSTVYPREVVKLALDHHAAAMIVAHNHPSGTLAPSEDDLKMTRTLHLACSFSGIQLLDHFIVGADDTPYSFADNGIMAAIREECANLL